MTTIDDFQPYKIGSISEGILGDLDLYLVDLPSTVDKVYNERISNQETSSGMLDEFYFLAPSSTYGTQAEKKNSANAYNFVAPKMGSEPFVLHKAHFHYVGKYIEVASQDDLDVKSSFDQSSLAWFTLPKIPSIVVDQLDKFFRAIDKKMHSEAIVLLTYNYDYRSAPDPSQGWGFGVPDQKNNSVHCDYEKKNVVEALPPNTKIVGTVHSHPGMAAYASKTDHEDQAGFDGLHITFGWPPKGDTGATEFHSELVRGDTFYPIDPGKVMDLDSLKSYEVTINGETHLIPIQDLKIVDMDYELEDSLLESWTNKVEATPIQNTGNYWNNKSRNASNGGGTPKVPALNQGNATSNFLPSTFSAIPDGICEFGVGDYPDPELSNVFIVHNVDAAKCYLCDFDWKKSGTYGSVEDRRQCLNCGSFIIFGDEQIHEIDDYRKANGFTPFANFMDFNLPFVVYQPTTGKFTSNSYIVVNDNEIIRVDNPKALA